MTTPDKEVIKIPTPPWLLNSYNVPSDSAEEREETTHVFPPQKQVLEQFEVAPVEPVHIDRIRWNQTGRCFMSASVCLVAGGTMAIFWMIYTTLGVPRNCTEPCNGWFVSV
jgi:hypothetical protein